MKKFFVSIIFLLLVCGMYYFIPTAVALYERAFAQNEQQSTIAGVAVEHVSDEEIKQALQQAIQAWEAQGIMITGAGKTMTVGVADIQFDVDASLARYKQLTDKPWYLFWEKRPSVHIPLTAVLTEETKAMLAQVPQWQSEETAAKLLAHATNLQAGPIEAVIDEEAQSSSPELLAAVRESIPKNALGLEELIQSMEVITLPADEEFSFLQIIGEQKHFANEQALNFVASMLYSVALQANSEIVERHSQHAIPLYLEPGIEAAIEKNGSKDLRFINRIKQVIELQWTLQGERLKLEAYTTESVQPALLTIKREQEVAPRVITRYSTSLPVGAERVVEKGRDGLRVAVYRSHPTQGEELIGKDYYAPINKIIVKSAQAPEEEPPPNSVMEEAGEVDLTKQSTETVEQQEVAAPATSTEQLEDTAPMKQKGEYKMK